jgi:hypothetical protein
MEKKNLITLTMHVFCKGKVEYESIDQLLSGKDVNSTCIKGLKKDGIFIEYQIREDPSRIKVLLDLLDSVQVLDVCVKYWTMSYLDELI